MCHNLSKNMDFKAPLEFHMSCRHSKRNYLQYRANLSRAWQIALIFYSDDVSEIHKEVDLDII